MPDGYLGRAVILKIETATAGTYVTVGAMRTTSCSVNNGFIDVTTKDDGVWRKQIGGGIRTMEISGAGVYRNDASHKRMHVLSDGAAPFLCEIVFADGDKFAGSFALTKLERGGEYDKEETYSLTLESCGAITFTEAA